MLDSPWEQTNSPYGVVLATGSFGVITRERLLLAPVQAARVRQIGPDLPVNKRDFVSAEKFDYLSGLRSDIRI